MFRLILGLAVAALWFPLLTLTFAPAPAKLAAILSAGLTVPLTAVIAGPLVYALRRRLTLSASTLSGAAIGALGVIAYGAGTRWAIDLTLMLVFVAVGSISGVLFWVVGVYRNAAMRPANVHASAVGGSVER
jgi:hypothetical protein